MRTFGLVGHPLGHSFSQRYFTEKFANMGLSDECQYLNFDLESIDCLGRVLDEHPTLEGFNVTIPYKEQIIPLLDSLSEGAQRIGAVNCVRVQGGRLVGHNTDVFGAGLTIDHLTCKQPCRALVLGSGGASKAVREALRMRNIPYHLVSRTGQGEVLSYADLTEEVMREHRLIINTTPLGMYPRVDAAPEIPYRLLTPNHMLFDLIYNPAETLFMRRGTEQGARTASGGEMLIEQAEKSWEIWNI
ncbi:MAG: shikimate dehydrogenase [Rikenellaceae bacterium]|nr:shikimate dehydrogenase [Rikenellaceae bacterium]